MSPTMNCPCMRGAWIWTASHVSLRPRRRWHSFSVRAATVSVSRSASRISVPSARASRRRIPTVLSLWITATASSWRRRSRRQSRMWTSWRGLSSRIPAADLPRRAAISQGAVTSSRWRPTVSLHRVWAMNSVQVSSRIASSFRGCFLLPMLWHRRSRERSLPLVSLRGLAAVRFHALTRCAATSSRRLSSGMRRG